jgi:uncharacterized membrane protein YcjF (UPF0283 family)
MCQSNCCIIYVLLQKVGPYLSDWHGDMLFCYCLACLCLFLLLLLRGVVAAERIAAREQHQDEMLELHEREEAAAAEAAAAAEKSAHAAAMAEANLDGECRRTRLPGHPMHGSRQG